MKRFLIVLLALTLIMSACQKETIEDEANITEVPTEEPDLGYVLDGGDVHITEGGTTLANMSVDGDLYIDESVGEGDVTLENVTVEGMIYVLGGGANSVHFFSSGGFSTIVRNPFDTRITMDEVSSLGDVFFESGGTVEYYGPEDYSPAVSINIGGENTSEPIDVNLNGSYTSVNVNSQANVDVNGNIDDIYVAHGADGTGINIAEDGHVNSMDTYSQVDVIGDNGSLGEATMGASGSTLPGDIEKIGSHEDGTQVNVGGEEYTLPKTESTEYIGKYDAATDGSISGETSLSGISSIGVDYYGKNAPNTLTVDNINVVNSKMPATVFYSIVPRGNSIPSKEQIKSGFGFKSGSLSFTDKESDNQSIVIKGFDVKERTRYTVYFLLVDKNGKEMHIRKKDLSVSPPEDAEEGDNSGGESNETEDGGSSSNGGSSSGSSIDGQIVDGYPKVSLGGQSVTVTVAAYEKCKVYFLVETPEVLAMGTTPSDVRNGISKGAGMSMGDGEYLVFHGTLNVSSALKEYSTTLVTTDGEGGNPDNNMPDDAISETPGIFLVIEYSDGSLSQVYTYR